MSTRALNSASVAPGKTPLDRPGALSLERQADRFGRAADLHLESLERDIQLRTMFGKVLLGIAIVVNLATITLVTLTGLGTTELSDKLLITLISSTVAELAGLVLVVAKYLFPASRTPLIAPDSRKPSRNHGERCCPDRPSSCVMETENAIVLQRSGMGGCDGRLSRDLRGR